MECSAEAEDTVEVKSVTAGAICVKMLEYVADVMNLSRLPQTSPSTLRVLRIIEFHSV